MVLGLTAANFVALILAVHLPVAVEGAGDALLTGGALPLGIPAQNPD
jgi:hypothetical protein